MGSGCDAGTTAEASNRKGFRKGSKITMMMFTIAIISVHSPLDVVGEHWLSAPVEGPLKDIFHYTFDYPSDSSQSSPNYSDLLQQALDKLLPSPRSLTITFVPRHAECFSFFGANGYQGKWKEIWDNDAGANLAYLLWSNSTKIGCVVGECKEVQNLDDNRRFQTETATRKSTLFRKLSPEAAKGQPPFDQEYFDGLIARSTKLANLTDEDLEAPSNGTNAAAPAVPTVLTAGLDAILAAVFV
ncbi:SAG family member [Eimeria brunetti]|uniref:SAG family member n=1 Tax=Eimeria brunetti TaxID=51314 RepID=U6L638_9EIME|nr:SAG family member [Eimeria brunetti]